MHFPGYAFQDLGKIFPDLRSKGLQSYGRALLFLEYLRGEHRSWRLTGVQTGKSSWCWGAGGSGQVMEPFWCQSQVVPARLSSGLLSLGEQFHWSAHEISVHLPPGMKGACHPVQEIKYSFMMFKVVFVVIFVAPLHQVLGHRANPQPLPEARFL